MSTEATTRSNDRSSHEVQAASEIAADDRLTAGEAAWECFQAYSKERPEVVALWAFGIGFVLGWKLKPW